MQTPVPEAPLPPPDLSQVIVGTSGPPEWIAPVIVLSLGAVLLCIMLYPMVRAWARRYEAGGIDQNMLEEVHSLRERVSELEGQVSRVQELEERVDFTERLMAQREALQRLPREGGA